MNTNLVDYYHQRAAEYESIYSKPERQHDLQAAAIHLQQLFRGKEVLEIACGTGYWTERISKTAKSILATDINEPMISMAALKDYGKADIQFLTADIFSFPDIRRESLFAGFLWSHIRKSQLSEFLRKVNNLVNDGGILVFMDNRFVPGSNLPLAQSDDEGNSYQLRTLEDGSKHLVLKNFPDSDFLREQLSAFGMEVWIMELEYYWMAGYQKG